MKRIVCALLGLILSCLPSAAADVLQNGSFDTTNHWQVAPELLAITNWNGIAGGQAFMHPPSGYTGPVYYQDLNTAVNGGATCLSTITLFKNSAPAGNTIAAYLDCLLANGQTNRITLFNPNNNDVYGGTTFTNIFVLPATAQTLIRVTLSKLISGSFYVNDISLDAPPFLPDTRVVQNGDFETGTLSSWTLGWMPGAETVTNGGARSGSFAGRLNGWGPPSFLSQTINTRLQPGLEYTFTAYINVVSNMNLPPVPMPMYVPHLDVTVGSMATYHAEAINSSNLGWQKLELRHTFTADELTNTVTFLVGGMGLLLVDDLSALGPIVTDGGYETGTLTNWISNPAFSITNSGAHSGAFAAYADATLFPHSFLSQNIKTRLSPDVEYQLSAWVCLNPGDYGEYDYGEFIPHLFVGPTAMPFGVPESDMALAKKTAAGWQRLKLFRTFTAEELGSDLYIGVAKTGMYGTFLVDDLSVTPVNCRITYPTAGESFTNATALILSASVVTNDGRTVSQVQFLNNGVVLGTGMRDLLGEWDFGGGTHLSLMPYFNSTIQMMVDYQPPDSAPMFWMDGSRSSLTNFAGQFANNDPSEGTVDIGFSLSANDRLSAFMNGQSPLGTVVLTNGIRGDVWSTPIYSFFWSAPPAGTNALSVRVIYTNGTTNESESVVTFFYSGSTNPFTYTTDGSTITLTGYTGAGGAVTLPSTLDGLPVTAIGANAFSGNTGLTGVLIPSSITNIGDNAFGACVNLTSVFFGGNAPAGISMSAFSSTSATVYFLRNTTGWGTTFAGRPTLLWDPLVKRDSSFGFAANRFGFTITGSNNIPVVVEACTNLTAGVWVPLTNATLGTSGSLYFSDPSSGAKPDSYYRIVWP